MDKNALAELIERYKSDPESVYNTWFVGGEERMKAFRAFGVVCATQWTPSPPGRLAMTSKARRWNSC
ncbi:MAG TPA: hypothetical protein VJL59_17480 [Anaerolineales bacterium]|nr:hypothetical protein [Anaerolineales bacterium]